LLPTWEMLLNRSTRDRLIIFTRYPRSGETKTRLIPRLGADAAAQLQKEMTENTIRLAREFRSTHPVDLEVCFTGGDLWHLTHWLGSDLDFRPQGPGELGSRMARAIRRGLLNNRCAVVIGTDCPGLSALYLGQAFDQLPTADLVIGPAADGGYYLIGLTRLIPDLFQGIAWGSPQVLQATLAIADQQRLIVRQLPILNDLDRPADLDLLLPVVQSATRSRRQRKQTAQRISVIIPTYNEETTITQRLHELHAIGSFHEIIVADGGSTDRTREGVAQFPDVLLLQTNRGRARQLNHAASIATGDVLLFVHADVSLPGNAIAEIDQALSAVGTVGGAFRIKTVAESKHHWVVPLLGLADLRSRYTRHPYGDQAIFVHRSAFAAINGFPSVPILEDLFFSKKLSSIGKIAQCRGPVLVSGRRFLKHPIYYAILCLLAPRLARFGAGLRLMERLYGHPR